MSRHDPRRARRTTSLLAAAGVIVALSGACSGDEQPAPEEPAASAGSDGADAPVEVESDGLPADFPRDEVPLVEGDVVSVSLPDDGASAYTVLVDAGPGAPVDAVTEAVGLLEDAGWSTVTDMVGDPPIPQVLSMKGGEATRIIITNRPQGENAILTYSVSVTS